VPQRFYGVGVSRPCHADVSRCRRRVAAATLLVIRFKLLTLDTLRQSQCGHTETLSLGHIAEALLLWGSVGVPLRCCVVLVADLPGPFWSCCCAFSATVLWMCCCGCAAVDFLPRLLPSSSRERVSLGARIVGRLAKRHSLIAEQMQPVSVTLRAFGCMVFTLYPFHFLPG
jgi:hypothetical protein